ncbi:MAG TPA: mechanosensitive ion channel domain-containing protein [Methylomirabilota bacterium]|nr:mechanosensitive ion channel domain-containing protein [Methylomirabilota bacterium]HUI52117.1 mechanosensitive ion channel domain-containing protein [Terriglobales bacterium]
MKKLQKIAAVVLLVLIAASVYLFWISREPESVRQARAAAKANRASKSLVDQTSLKTAQQLAPLAVTYHERELAKKALRLADYEVDLTFDAALHEALLNPPPLSAEAKAIEDRIKKAQKLLDADQERAKQLSEQLTKAAPTKQDQLQVQLVQAQADMELDQDELDDAKEDFARAGGNLADRIQALKKEHEETTHGSESVISTSAPPPDQPGLLHRVQQWTGLRAVKRQVQDAKDKSEQAAASLQAQHNALENKIGEEQQKSPDLARHTKRRIDAAAGNDTPVPQRTAEEAAALLKTTQQIASDQKLMAMFDKRVEAHKELSAVYEQWIQLLTDREWAVVHRGVVGVLIILGISLVALFFSTWMNSLVSRLSMDRRQIQSLHTVTRVSLQVVALLLILLVMFGPPGQLGTFLGLAGAGLTVALKDFIVGFIGWFVLMGKNGIRLGDWVEINGVTGEVVEIGPFHTVLLETGNWTDSGHPTGRRVTFTNSFAIEGHYFNFSTTGQWLWDELSVVLPTGKDPYPIVEAIRKKVEEETKENGLQAEQEWRRATNSREMSGFSATPAISVKPVLGGVEVAIRYIARAHERFALRAKLNQAAVQLLGGVEESWPDQK